MPDDLSTWAMIHAERAALADTIEELTPAQWEAASLCRGWTVGFLSAHVLAGAEQTAVRFVTGLAASGFRFNTLMDREARSRGQLSRAEVAGRLRQRTTTTNRPPAPAVAMLGEAVVHGEDIRRPAGLQGTVAPEAVSACLQMFTAGNFPVGGKRRVSGLRL